jgi:hypothetical protein
LENCEATPLPSGAYLMNPVEAQSTSITLTAKLAIKAGK